MKRRNKIAAALLFAASIPAVSTWAQNSLRSAYFLEGIHLPPSDEPGIRQ